MPKPERGLPKTFDIKVPDRPVTLGDYLDDEPPRPVRRAEAFETPPPPPSLPSPPPPPVYTPAPPVAAPAPPTHAAAPPVRRKTPSRKQINLTPETLRMLDEILLDIRARSAERDVRASEVLHALVLAAYEARPWFDLGRIQPRGQWGSATAAALPLSLRDALRGAISASSRSNP